MTNVETKSNVVDRPIRASVVLTTISTHLGWGNNPLFSLFKNMVIADNNGYITKESRESLILAISTKKNELENPIHRGQLDNLFNNLTI